MSTPQTQTPGTTTSGGALQQRPFLQKPTLIPQLGEDGKWNGRFTKIELVLVRGLDGGAREHLWVGPDPRPHNHPWEWIACKVVRGWYKAIEYRPDGNGGYTVHELTLRAGDPEHILQHDAHHQIVDVEPGTISVMSFGAIIGDGKQWGHLVDNGNGTYRYEPAAGGASEEFVNALRHCNPQIPRPEGWVDPYADHPAPTIEEVLTSVGI